MKYRYWSTALVIVLCSQAIADGSSIDSIHQPYVHALEKEIEYQLLFENENREYEKNISRHQLGYGQAVTDRLFLEASLTFSDTDSIELVNYELEAIYQLSEQGEYASDWGVLFELEKSDGEAIWEVGAGLLNSFSWQRWQFTSNLLLEYEWGDAIDNEFETALSAMSRYRHRPGLEPGIEVFVGEDTLAYGPAMSGTVRVDGPRKFYWSLALLFGSRESPERTLKCELEYEFY